MKISLLFLIVLFCGSCAGYRVSRFTTDPVKIGSPKELVLKKRNYILFTPKIRFSFEFSKSLYSNSFSKFIVISIAITV